MDHWCTYLLRCSDGSLYCGATNNLKRRVRAHNNGTGAKYTRARRPVVLVWSQPCDSKRAALKLEAHIKKLSRSQKLQMIEDTR